MSKYVDINYIETNICIEKLPLNESFSKRFILSNIRFVSARVLFEVVLFSGQQCYLLQTQVKQHLARIKDKLTYDNIKRAKNYRKLTDENTKLRRKITTLKVDNC